MSSYKRSLRAVAVSLLLTATTGSAFAESLPASGPKILTIDGAIKIALKANRNILSAGYTINDNRLSAITAESAFDMKIFPGVDMIAGVSDGEDSSSYGAGLTFQKLFPFGSRVSIGPSTVKTSDGYSSSLRASYTQPLLRGLGRKAAKDSVTRAWYAVGASEKSWRKTRSDIALATAKAFYEVITSQDLAMLYANLAVKMTRHTEASMAKEAIGYATPMDTYRARINQKGAEDAATQATNETQAAIDNLKLILAIRASQTIRLQPPEPVDVQDPMIKQSAAVSIALANRVEMKHAQAELEEASRAAGIAAHNTLPKVDLVVSATGTGTAESLDDSARLGHSSWSAQLISTTDISRTAEKAAHSKALISVKRAGNTLFDTRDKITKEVIVALRTKQSNMERVDIIKQKIEQAKGKLELAQVKFNFGMADNFNIIEAEIELAQARASLTKAKHDVAVNTHQLSWAMGTLIKEN